MADILVVDDEIGIRELLSEILGDEGHTVLLAESAREARLMRDDNRLDLVLLDIWMPDTDGVSLLKEWSAGGKLTMPVIMMSGHATIDTAVEATKIGAIDFLEKPITMQKLLRAVEKGLHRREQQVTGRLYRDGLPPNAQRHQSDSPGSLGGSGVMAARGDAGLLDANGAGSRLGAMPAAVAVADLPLELPLREARDAFERAYFEHHLSRENGSMTRVAERTGLERTHLYRKLKQLGIDLAGGAYRKNNS
ncbi:MAG: response regulator [Burkholderiaceae bacterium]|nr:response regulator [Burkholderiaceae bacterium]